MPQVTPTTSQPPLGAATAPSSSSSYFAPGTTSAAASTSMRPPTRTGSPAGRRGAARTGAVVVRVSVQVNLFRVSCTAKPGKRGALRGH